MKSSLRTFIKHTAKDFHNQSVNPPVVRASTIIFKNLQEIEKTEKKYLKDPRSGNFNYGRQGTSTAYALQRILQEMEECYKVYLAPTGFGAVFLAVLSVVEPGDEILVTDSVYSPTRLLTQDYLKKFKVKSIFYDPTNFNDLKNKISNKTKLIFVENPGSNTFEFQDLKKIISLAKKYKIYTAIDNTWGTPYLIKPIKLGFDTFDYKIEEAAYINGASKLDCFISIILPQIFPSVITGITLSFARCLAEFGATITFVSNIPGETQTLPLALYTATQIPGTEESAMRLVIISIVLAFVSVAIAEILANKTNKRINNYVDNSF